MTGLDWGDDEWFMFIISPVLFVCLLYIILSPIFTGDWEDFNKISRMSDSFTLYLNLLVMLYLLILLLFIM